MATGLNRVMEHLRRTLLPTGLADGELLSRFVAAHDEPSFTTLVRRHGPMVWGVCKRVLRHHHDAEDAFQATFLILARKAGSVLKRASLSSWLYRVALRTALEARTVNARRRVREKQVEDLPQSEVPAPEIQDWRPFLDQELGRLREKYRAAVVLCDLEGVSRKEAARRLGIPEGTLSSRLATARQMLAKRLGRYGLTLSGGALALGLGEEATAAVPMALVSSTVKAGLLLAAGQAAALVTPAGILMKEVIRSMFMTKVKLAMAVVMVVTALGTGGIVYRTTVQAAPPGKPRSELEALRRENELLKLNLEVVLEKVRDQEAELRTLRGTTGKLAATEARTRQGAAAAEVREGEAAQQIAELNIKKAKLEAAIFELNCERATAELKVKALAEKQAAFMAQHLLNRQAQAYEEALMRKKEDAEKAALKALIDVKSSSSIQEIEAGLKVLREARDKEAMARAILSLEKALKDLQDKQDKALKDQQNKTLKDLQDKAKALKDLQDQMIKQPEKTPAKRP